MLSADNKVNKMQNINGRRPLSCFFLVSVALWVGHANLAAAFVQTAITPGSKQTDFSSASIITSGTSDLFQPRFGRSCRTNSNTNNNNNNAKKRQSTELYSFMGSDGGLFGIGTPELFTIVLIGYFVLGPSDLYKLVKEIGKFIQNFQNFATEATTTLENNMESQLQLEEIRKAQRELNDAFSFRRSINVEKDSDPFEVNVQSPRGQDDVVTPAIKDLEYDLSTTATGAAAVAATDGAEVAPKKKKMRRIKKNKKSSEPAVEGEVPKVPADIATTNKPLVNDIPAELDIDEELRMAEEKAMETIFNDSNVGNEDLQLEEKETSNLAAQIREERIERLQGSTQPQESAMDQSRFQQQMSGDWNSQILANNDKLEPLGEVMNLLAVLEEEKIAADLRLQEEFKAREANEEEFYLEKRKLLEEAAAQVQASAYAGNIPMTSSTVSQTGNQI
uniref:Uncharacterized protein n=2 Tax=Pseudo-nitzschia australis TaxID=44445 RepID=A0A7S4EEW7_9STRA|mmetsp:Transcript_19675/g.42781  ORF Transcript_19675/g.42781 Transcript_19675/m.42781 type:complete len:448 (+) Transcript_19675:232-1575(+)